MCGAKARVASCRQRERGYVYVHHAEVAGHEGRHRVVFFVRMSNWLRPKHAAADLIECVRFAKDSPLEESGFEPSVPPCERVGFSCRNTNTIKATRMLSKASAM